MRRQLAGVGLALATFTLGSVSTPAQAWCDCDYGYGYGYGYYAPRAYGYYYAPRVYAPAYTYYPAPTWGYGYYSYRSGYPVAGSRYFYTPPVYDTYAYAYVPRRARYRW